MEITAKMRLLLDSISALGYIVEVYDSNGIYLYCSENGAIDVASTEDLIGKHLTEVTEVTENNSLILRCIRTGIPIRDALVHYYAKKSKKSYLWFFSCCPLLENGVVCGAITLYRPFTNAKDAIDAYSGSEFSANEYPEATLNFKEAANFRDSIYASPKTADAIRLCKETAEIEISAKTKLILDSVSALGYVVEVYDGNGIYLYCSENGAIDIDSTKELIGKHLTEVTEVTEGNSLILRSIRTGIPIRDALVHYYAKKSKKSYLWLFSCCPLLENGIVCGAITLYRPFSNAKEAIDAYSGSEFSVNENSETALNVKEAAGFKDIIYASPKMAETIRLSKKAAKNDFPVLIVGETGTGKDLLARNIHANSTNPEGPFVAVNCAAIPETLIESILFGVEKGAYTGAVERPGLFEQSNNGTLFLDEIQTLSTEMQSKLLRVLEDKKVRRVGGKTESDLQFRLITAMNVNPYEYIKAGKMKPDLYYRIAVLTIHIPPLRERVKDISLLASTFVQKTSVQLNRTISGCSKEALHALETYKWPGNVRELQHAIMYASVSMDESSNIIQYSDLPDTIKQGQPPSSPHQDTALPENSTDMNSILSLRYKEAHQLARDEFDAKFHVFYLKHVLEETGYNISDAAEKMDISRQYLHRLLIKYHVQ